MTCTSAVLQASRQRLSPCALPHRAMSKAPWPWLYTVALASGLGPQWWVFHQPTWLRPVASKALCVCGCIVSGPWPHRLPTNQSNKQHLLAHTAATVVQRAPAKGYYPGRCQQLLQSMLRVSDGLCRKGGFPRMSMHASSGEQTSYESDLDLKALKARTAAIWWHRVCRTGRGRLPLPGDVVSKPSAQPSELKMSAS
jgi:hypothetical protein